MEQLSKCESAGHVGYWPQKCAPAIRRGLCHNNALPAALTDREHHHA